METSPNSRKRGIVNVLMSILPYFLIVGIFQYIASLLVNLDIRKVDTEEMSSLQFFVINLVGLMGTIFALWLILKFVDKKPFSDLGFSGQNAIRDIVLGVLFGLVIMLVGFLTLKLSRQISVDSIQFNALSMILAIAIFVIVAFAEEMYFRGYVLNNLMRSYGKFTALVISALFFAMVHLLNPDFSFSSFIGIFLAGLLLGMSFIFTKSLWFPIALHFSWNFFQSFFGFNVSGTNTYSLINTKFNTETIWNGGKFGFESSLLAVLFQLVAIAIVFYIFKNRKIAERA